MKLFILLRYNHGSLILNNNMGCAIRPKSAKTNPELSINSPKHHKSYPILRLSTVTVNFPVLPARLVTINEENSLLESSPE